VGYVPEIGQHVAWAESSAVSYANSVLGARTNREGGPSALAAAIAGRTARYGLHLDENRLATVVIDVLCAVKSTSDLGALGYLVGQRVGSRIPYLRLWDSEPETWNLNTLCAAMAASGAVALYHIEGVTLEARACDMVVRDAHRLVVDDLAPGYAALDGTAREVDLVSLGCPHASLAELETIAAFLVGRHVKTTLWITTARDTRHIAEEAGWVPRIQAAGGRVVADTCMVVAPVADLGFRTMATNSAKMAFYAPAHSGLSVRFGSTERCLEAALAGSWPAPQRT
jgi:predicted aconitase